MIQNVTISFVIFWKQFSTLRVNQLGKHIIQPTNNNNNITQKKKKTQEYLANIFQCIYISRKPCRKSHGPHSQLIMFAFRIKVVTCELFQDMPCSASHADWITTSHSYRRKYTTLATSRRILQHLKHDRVWSPNESIILHEMEKKSETKIISEILNMTTAIIYHYPKVIYKVTTTMKWNLQTYP